MLVPYSSFVAAAAAAAADGPLPLEGWLHNNHHSNDELPIQFSFLLSLGCSIIMFLASYALNALHQIGESTTSNSAYISHGDMLFSSIVALLVFIPGELVNNLVQSVRTMLT
ncbi:uncharacterized protein LOC122082348 isoform X1 [Macadamia integrifolia]|uniref:uncharacterized protein LOC122082348 isoform X1 n=1 Tax=Macadamia integrifolia TaxID=60698 RepID=UPI001C4FAC9B|nr:uncharacterized protein LOC122082348 isoform X1 [Macadamia integrifolia]